MFESFVELGNLTCSFQATRVVFLKKLVLMPVLYSQFKSLEDKTFWMRMRGNLRIASWLQNAVSNLESQTNPCALGLVRFCT